MRKKELKRRLRMVAPWLLPKKKPGRIASAIKMIKASIRHGRRLKLEEKQWPRYGARERLFKSPERAEERVLKLMMNGSIGMQTHKRIVYLDRAIGQKFKSKNEMKKFFRKNTAGEYIIPNEFQHVPLGMALRRAFAWLELPSKEKRARVKAVIERLHKEGRISFKESTEVTFTKDVKAEIMAALAPRGDEFMEHFEMSLQDSTNWVKDYLHWKIDNVLREPWDDAFK